MLLFQPHSARADGVRAEYSAYRACSCTRPSTMKNCPWNIRSKRPYRFDLSAPPRAFQYSFKTSLQFQHCLRNVPSDYSSRVWYCLSSCFPSCYSSTANSKEATLSLYSYEIKTVFKTRLTTKSE
jgi:hypothetical protein